MGRRMTSVSKNEIEVVADSNKKQTNKNEKVKEKSTQHKKPQQMIYVGPNLSGGRLSSYSVFKDGIPAYLSDLIDKQPAIKNLIVPLSELSKAQSRKDAPGTLEHQAYKELSQERKGTE